VKPGPEDEVDLDRDSDPDEDLLKPSGSEEEKQPFQEDELKLLGQRAGFAGGRPRPLDTKEWIEQSIRQSVSDWKAMLKPNKENNQAEANA